MTPLPFTLRIYQRLLRLYPRGYRERYAAEQFAVACALYQDRLPLASPRQSVVFAVELARDFAFSLTKQSSSQLWRFFMKRPVVVYSTILFVLIAGIVVFSAIFDHALLRRSANQPQQQMAERYAQRLSAGAAPAGVLPGGHIDITRDLDPFVNVYDESGQPIAGNGYLGDALPVPPAGVLAAARDNGINRISWRPQTGTRVAIVAKHFTGVNSGFVVAGRSLSDVERQESQVYGISLHVLLLMFIAITGTGIMLTRAVDRRPGTAAA